MPKRSAITAHEVLERLDAAVCARGRGLRLTEREVNQIREAYWVDGRGVLEIAAELRVTRESVHAIAVARTRATVPPSERLRMALEEGIRR